MWELSILRLNQLGYFEVLKEEEAADIKRDTKTNTVDITLKVKERGKNSIQLNGGVSGIAGSFVGFSYSTNNLLGLGETLSLNAQLGTTPGQRDSSASPSRIFFDKPHAGRLHGVHVRASITTRRAKRPFWPAPNLTALYNQLGTQNLLNYVRQFARLHRSSLAIR